MADDELPFAPASLTKMDHFKVIKHPLDQFSFSENVGELGPEGRASLEQITQLIGDMRFLRGTAESTRARYFLLVDSSWVPKLCFSARINCVKLREHLWRCELGESQDGADGRQTVLPFAETKRDPGVPSAAAASQPSLPEEEAVCRQGAAFVTARVAKAIRELTRQFASLCTAKTQLVSAQAAASNPKEGFRGRQCRTS